VTASRLRRNREFALLQVSQLASSGGSQITAIAYPLLVLALTGSSAKAGLVAFARLLGMALFALPAGLAADRWNRRRVIVAALALRALAVGCLGALILLGEVVFWQIPVVGFIEGSGAAVSSAAQAGALRAVVPKPQLPAAVSVVTGRDAAISLAAPPLGGALFGVSRALPFLVHAAVNAFAAVALLAIRTPFQEQRQIDRSPLRAQLAEGLRFLWHQPFLRTCALLFGLANFIGPGVLLAIVVIGEGHGLSGGEIGLLVSAFGGCVVLGAVLSPFVRRVLPVRGVLLLELWTWVGCGLFVVWPSVYVLTLSILPTALVIPSTDSVVVAYRLAMTPDRLVGRVNGVTSAIALLLAPLGPPAAGLLLEAVSERATIALFAVCGLVLAVWGTLSPSIRSAPSLDELSEPSARDVEPVTSAAS
jgi:MFS family permease